MDGPLHVLIVDDNPDDRLLLRRLLRQEFAGIQIREAADPAALDLALAEPSYDAIVTDFHLSWSDGLAVLARIRAVAPECVVLMFTGTGSEEVAVEAMKRGLDDYVLKSPKHALRLPAALRGALARRAAQRKAAAAELRLHQLLDRLDVGVFRATLDGKVLDSNRAFRDLLGVSEEQLAAVSLPGFYADPAERERLLASLRSERAVHDFHVELRRLDGRSLWASLTEALSQDEAGACLVDGILEDITEKLAAAARIEHQNRLALVGQFAGGLAHDLNNILVAILTYPQALLREEALSERARRALETVAAQARRGAEIVRKMLDFSRQSRSEPCAVAVEGFVTDLVRVLRSVIPETIRIESSLTGAGGSDLWADPTQLQQIVMNLALNARDAMPVGGVLTIAAAPVRVEEGEAPPCAGLAAGRWVRLTVRDTGTGILPEHMGRLFEPFFTTKPAGEGTGLGLSQVYGLVQANGGQIAVTSVPGAGTTFDVYLPMSRVPRASGDAAAGARRAVGRGETVLLVEDEGEVRQALRLALEILGFRVVEAPNGAAALEALDGTPGVDVVVTDGAMPVMGGLDLLHAMTKAGRSVPTIVLTGHSTGGSAAEFRAAGACEIATKPVELDDLGAMVLRALGR
ncbi:MAG TPA: response regulator [Thermoanaerobaculaceae bacterium]|nr:response regulator [Thermoanaerobaculaceae bacterium]